MVVSDKVKSRWHDVFPEISPATSITTKSHRCQGSHHHNNHLAPNPNKKIPLNLTNSLQHTKPTIKPDFSISSTFINYLGHRLGELLIGDCAPRIDEPINRLSTSHTLYG